MLIVVHSDQWLQPDVMRRQFTGRSVNCVKDLLENRGTWPVFAVSFTALVTEKIHAVKYVLIAVMIHKAASVYRISDVPKRAS